MKTTFSASDEKLLKACGVSPDDPKPASKCDWCNLNDVREEDLRTRAELSEQLSGTLAKQAHADRKHAMAMRHQRNLAMFALGVVFLIAGIRAVWK